VRAARVEGCGVPVDVPDDALLVHDEGSSVRKPVLRIENAVLLGDGPLEITEEGGNHADFLGVGLVGRSAVHADPEDLRPGGAPTLRLPTNSAAARDFLATLKGVRRLRPPF